MKNHNLQDLILRIDELQVVPLIEDIITYIKEIKPLLESISSSIEENLQKMPSASFQLSQVTEATENAVISVMNFIDKIYTEISGITTGLEIYRDNFKVQINNIIQQLEQILPKINAHPDFNAEYEILLKVINSLENTSDRNSEIEIITNEIMQSVLFISNDLSAIMLTLQVQDITSQQIAAVNHLLHSVQSKFSNIIGKIHNTELDLLFENNFENNGKNINPDLNKELDFDPNAINGMFNSFAKQEEVDSLIKFMDNENSGYNHNHNNNNNNNNGEKSGNTENKNINGKKLENNIEVTLSKDDIAKLFGDYTGKIFENSKEKFSNNDIKH